MGGIDYDSGKRRKIKELPFGVRIAHSGAGSMRMRATRLTLGLMTIAVALTAQLAPPPQEGPGAPPPQSAPPQSAQGPADAQAPADEPGRAVARISVLSGDASVTRGDAGTPVAAAVNAPLMAGDSLSVAAGATAELQLDAANFARIAGDSQIRVSSLDNGKYQIQLAKGLVTYRVLRQTNAQSEIDTPLIAVHPFGLSSVRVEVAPDGSTRVTVRHGAADVYTPKGTERVNEGSTMMVRGAADDPEFQVVTALTVDQWDTWNDQRDTYLSRAQSPRYASPDVVGTEDLDNYGRWSNDPQYGNVWTPNVPPTWAPYRNGQWVWEDYYGWTWVDYDPWGWAPFHYGSWYFRTGFGWSWFPGPRFGHYWYHPALVGFVGFGGVGVGVGFGFGSVGWIPLAPFEIFRPWYGAGWFGGGRIVNNINIVRNVNVIGAYRNARFANGVTAVSSADFQRGNFRNPVALDRAQLSQASQVRGAVPVTPTASNLAFGNRGGAAVGPQSNINNQRFYSRMTPGGTATQRTPFNQQSASVHSAFQSRGIQTGSAPSGLSGGSTARASASSAARSPASGGGASAGWQRFGSSSSGGAGTSYGGQSRSLQVAPPMVRQREAGQSYGGSQSPSYRGGAATQSPAYRGGSAAPAPAYRSAPAPSRSAPAAAPRGGGGSRSGGSGGHGGGRR
jgi:hypothetical protein